MVTGLLLANFQQGDRNDSVRQSVRQVAEMLRKSQNAALSGVTAGVPLCPIGQCGFGVEVLAGQAPIYFFDADNSRTYEASEQIWGGAQPLSPGVTMRRVTASRPSPGHQDTPGAVTILFSPPSGTMVIVGGINGATAWRFDRENAGSQFLDINSTTGRISY